MLTAMARLFAFMYCIFTSLLGFYIQYTLTVKYSMFVSVSPCFLSLTAGSNVLLGDGLVLVSAALYAVSNLCQEYTVKNLTRVEFLGMMGFFGTLISGVQM